MNKLNSFLKTVSRVFAISLLAACLVAFPLPAKAAAALLPAGQLSDKPSNIIGTIGALAPKPGMPSWDGADRAHDMAFFGGKYAIIVGHFSTYVKSQSYSRPNMVIIDMTTGAPTGVSLPIKGEVLTVKITPQGDAAYIGGDFSLTQGDKQRVNAAKFNLTTGELLDWDPRVNKTVQDIDLGGPKRNKVLLAGAFTTVNGINRGYFASVTSTTGQLTEWVNLRLAEPADGAPLLGLNFVTNSDSTLIAGTGNFGTVNGKAHKRIFVLKATTKKAVLTPWATTFTKSDCGANKVHEELGAVFSGKYKLGLADTGGDVRGSICDSVSVWNLRDTSNTKAKPTWVNYTNKDSMSGVAFYRGYTYGAGHNKACAVNPGRPYEVVAHPGLCEYNAATGQLTSWNPTTSRQRSMHVRLVPTPANFQVQGLFYVGDANQIGGGPRNDIAFFPAL